MSRLEAPSDRSGIRRVVPPRGAVGLHVPSLDWRLRRSTGMTLVELLVVVAIIGVLISLMLPAVQNVRESARSVSCRNHLKQLGLAALAHHDAHGHFPSGGWGHAWLGYPERGFGVEQPGGWIYNLLPFIESDALREIGRETNGEARSEAHAKRLRTPIAMLNCPSRRASQVWPTVDVMPHLQQPRETSLVTEVARSDYAINGGDAWLWGFEGPATLAEGDDRAYGWADMSSATGVSHLRSEVAMARLDDGASSTYLIGEKYINPLYYFNGVDPGDNESMYNGFCADLHRYTRADFPFHADRAGVTNPLSFGSAHAAGCNFVFADGSTRSISYDIDRESHRAAGCRNDHAAR